jgi:hypothetical protein
MNCHNQVKTDSPLLQVVRDTLALGAEGAVAAA